MKWKKPVHSLKVSGLHEDQKDSMRKLDDLQNLLTKLTVKTSADKEWLPTLWVSI